MRFADPILRISSATAAIVSAFGIITTGPPVDCQVHQPGTRTQLPTGTSLAVVDSAHGKTYAVSSSFVEMLPDGQKFTTENLAEPIECVLPSPDGRAIIVRTIDSSYMFDLHDAKKMRAFRLTCAWWAGKSVDYLDMDTGVIHVDSGKTRMDACFVLPRVFKSR